MATKHDEAGARILTEAARREIDLRRQADEAARSFLALLNSSLCPECQGRVAASLSYSSRSR